MEAGGRESSHAAHADSVRADLSRAFQTALGAVSDLAPAMSAEGSAPLADMLGILQQAVIDLDSPLVKVAFSGHFSSGKSTLINSLLGRAILPTGYLPETGVPCHIRAGERDGAVVALDDGDVLLPIDPAHIAEYVSLIDTEGSYREGISKVRRLNITVASNRAPRNAEFIDSPGINDMESTTAVVRAVCEAADIVIWVVSSKQPLSQVETAFLKSFLDDGGLGKLVFVVNAFLLTDSLEQWRRYMAERAGFINGRIERSLPPIDYFLRWDVVHVSASALRSAPQDFGGPQLRRLVADVISPNGRRLDESRSRRALRAGLRITTDLHALAEFLSDRLMTAQQAETQRQRELFEKAVRSEVATEFSDARRAVADRLAAAAFAASWRNEESQYAWAVQATIEGIASVMASRLASRLNVCAHRHGFELDQAASGKLLRALRPAALDVVIPAAKSPSELGRDMAAAVRRVSEAVLNRDPAGTVGGALTAAWNAERRRMPTPSARRAASRERITAGAQAVWREMENRQAAVAGFASHDLVTISSTRRPSASAASSVPVRLAGIAAELQARLGKAESRLDNFGR
jgi:hypothetical protein